MPRPFAVTGFTMFAVLLVLCCTGIRFCMVLTGFMLALFVVSLLLKSARAQRVFPAAALAGFVACVLFAVNYNVSYKPAVSLDEGTYKLTAALKDSGSSRYEKWYYDAQIETLDGERCSYDVTLVLNKKIDAVPADKVSGTFRIYAKKPNSDILKINGSGTVIGAYPESGSEDLSVIKTNNAEVPLSYRIFLFREKLKTNLRDVISGENATIAAALLFGRTSGFSDSLYSRFSAAGISHIICVSGLHLSVWSIFVLKALGKARVKRRARGIIASAFVVFYMALTGFTFSVVRAGIMLLVMLLGSTVFRRGDSINSLGIAAIAILCKNPFAVADTGFQLSFLATLGILLFLPKVNKKLKEKTKNLPHILRTTLNYFLLIIATCLCAGVLTLPVMIITFGEINLMSFVGNIVVVPVVSVCMISAGFTAVLPFSGPLSVLKYPAGLLCSLCAKYINSAVAFLSHFRFLTFYPRQNLAYIWLGGAMLIAAVALFFASKGKKTAVMTSVILAASFVSMLIVSDFFYSDLTEITVIDNKNALCVLVTKGDSSALIGAGADYYSTSRGTCSELEKKHIDSLNLLVVPRDNYRESGAVNEVLSCVKTDVFACSKVPDYSASLAHNSEITQFGDRFVMQLCDGCRVTCVNNQNNCYALIEAQGRKAVIVFNSDSEIPRGDFLICKKETLQIADTALYKGVIISGDTDTVSLQNTVNSSGTLCAATAGQGSVTLSVTPGSDYKLYRQ
ncbi:MAG: ComEC/Rec2 family competence protein [Clostridia bacterium]|nr:ComEC/Rec2 family competence protein [Clostridia bacterium]